MEIARSAAAVGCSKEQQRIYADWFALADPDGDGRVTGADAIKFFAMSGLSRADLKQVWAICDSKRQGFLGFGEFAAAMQLVSLAQAGNEVTQDSLKREDLTSFDPPVMKGLDELLSRSMAIVNAVRPEKNGTSQVQAPATNNWFSSKSAKKMQTPLTAVTSVIDGLKRLYIEKLKPLEVACRFNDFASPLLTNSDFDAKPTVMLLGQYSTGKTTFIKHLLKTSYPGAHVGPEPTTDRFIVVMQKHKLMTAGNKPKKACDRRVNEFVKRARAAKIHALIMGHLKKEMPAMMGKAKAQQRLIDNLQDEFAKVQREYHLPAGDFPDVEHFKEVLATYSIDKFEKIKPKMVQAVDDMLAYDIPELLKNLSNPYQ